MIVATGAGSACLSDDAAHILFTIPTGEGQFTLALPRADATLNAMALVSLNGVPIAQTPGAHPITELILVDHFSAGKVRGQEVYVVTFQPAGGPGSLSFTLPRSTALALVESLGVSLGVYEGPPERPQLLS